MRSKFDISSFPKDYQVAVGYYVESSISSLEQNTGGTGSVWFSGGVGGVGGGGGGTHGSYDKSQFGPSKLPTPNNSTSTYCYPDSDLL